MTPVSLLPAYSESSTGSLTAVKHSASLGLATMADSKLNQMKPMTVAHIVNGRPKEVADISPRTTFQFDSMQDALAAFGRGEFLVVLDDEGRENEGDLIIAASECSTEKMAWMIKHTRSAPFSRSAAQTDRDFTDA